MADEKVKDVMTKKVLTLDKNATLADVRNYFKRNPYYFVLPLVDANQNLIGIVSRRNFELYSASFSPSAKASKIMIKQAVTISPDASLNEALTKMNWYKISVLPVTKEKRVVGIITRHAITENQEMPLRFFTITSSKPPSLLRRIISFFLESIKLFFNFLMVIGVIIFAIGYLWYYVAPFLNSSPLNFISEVNGEINPGFPHWASKTITYEFSSNNPCSTQERADINSAFNILHNQTNGLLSFFENSGGKILISCYDSYDSRGASAWAAPWLNQYGQIEKATIDFYKIPPTGIECQTYPHLEIHEILHTLGFEDDFSSAQGVMYFGRTGEYWNPCNQLDTRIAECLKNIYSNGNVGNSCTGIPHKTYGG